jgi:hypothetical protein
VRFGARDYDPTTGRWLTKDPLGFAAGINFYAFCGNDPVNRIDPTGLWTMRLGFQASFNTISSVNINIGLAIGYSESSGFTVGVVGGAGGGVALVGCSAGGFLEVTNADSVNDLKGGSIQAGGSFGEGLVLGGDYIVGLNGKGMPSYQGVEVNLGIGGGLPLDLHVLGSLSTGFATKGKPCK